MLNSCLINAALSTLGTSLLWTMVALYGLVWGAKFDRTRFRCFA